MRKLRKSVEISHRPFTFIDEFLWENLEAVSHSDSISMNDISGGNGNDAGSVSILQRSRPKCRKRCSRLCFCCKKSEIHIGGKSARGDERFSICWVRTSKWSLSYSRHRLTVSTFVKHKLIAVNLSLLAWRTTWRLGFKEAGSELKKFKNVCSSWLIYYQRAGDKCHFCYAGFI